MLFDVVKQLDALTQTLHLVSNVAGPVEPGQKVELKVLSGAPDLFVTNKILDNPILGGALSGTAQLLPHLPVEIRVQWSITKDKETLKPGNDFLATNGMEGPFVDFIFKPEFKDLGTVMPMVDDSMRIITAEITLRTWLNNVAPNAPNTAVPQEVVSKKVNLSLMLALVPLEIPTILALFRFPNYRSLESNTLEGGFVLIVVPEHSYLQDLTEQMNDLLVQIDQAVRPIRTLLGLAAFLSGLTILRQALSAQPMFRVRHGNISDLDEISMRVETRFGIDWLNPDLRPNDRISSLILMGPKGQKVGCYNDKDHDTGEGAFEVDVGDEMITLVPVLKIPSAELDAHPHVTVIETNDDENFFDESMTSIKFLS